MKSITAIYSLLSPSGYFITVVEGGRREGWSAFLFVRVCKEREAVRCRVRLGMWEAMQIHFQRPAVTQLLKTSGRCLAKFHATLKFEGKVFSHYLWYNLVWKLTERGEIAFGGQGICIAHFFCRCLIGSDTGFIRIRSRLWSYLKCHWR